MQVFGLLGNPVGHSLSPPMHEAAYATLDMDARYVTFEPDPEDIEQALRGARALGIAGLNVTIPFKQDVLSFVDPDPLAARIGAVNTIDVTTGTGYNTDAEGVVRALRANAVELSASGTAVVVGAGGAGRAAAFALADEGMTVHIVNRTVERAIELAEQVPDASGYGLDALSSSTVDLLADADVLVNATSVGMDEDVSPVPDAALHADLAVLDAVYTPLETRLLRDASAVGATTIDGGWMLLYQGAAAFEHWTGCDAPIDPMNDVLRDNI